MKLSIIYVYMYARLRWNVFRGEFSSNLLCVLKHLDVPLIVIVVLTLLFCFDNPKYFLLPF